MVSLSSESNRPFTLTGRARRQLRLRGEKRRAAVVPPDDRRLADVRLAVCQRVVLSRTKLGRSPSPRTRRAGATRDRSHLSRGRDLNPRMHRVAAGGLSSLATSTAEGLRVPAHHRAPGAPRASCWVTVRYRSGTFAFTARRAEPLHHGHHVSSPSFCAPVWNRTSISWASARRHRQIGFRGVVVAGVVPGHGIVDY